MTDTKDERQDDEKSDAVEVAPSESDDLHDSEEWLFEQMQQYLTSESNRLLDRLNRGFMRSSADDRDD